MKTFTRFGDTRQPTWLIVTVAIFSAAWPCAAHALSYASAATPYSWIPTAAHTQITSWDGGLGCVDAAGDDSLSAPCGARHRRLKYCFASAINLSLRSA